MRSGRFCSRVMRKTVKCAIGCDAELWVLHAGEVQNDRFCTHAATRSILPAGVVQNGKLCARRLP